MRMRNRVVVWMLAGVLGSTAVAAGDGNRATFIGGTTDVVSKRTDGTLHLSDDTVFRFRSRGQTIEVAYSRINLIEYGQKVDRRYVMAIAVSPLFLLSKSRRHFLTVGYTTEDGKQQALVFKVEKSEIRPVLASLEARTGVKVTYQDQEARLAGKG
jgi:hypothetical protein